MFKPGHLASQSAFAIYWARIFLFLPAERRGFVCFVLKKHAEIGPVFTRQFGFGAKWGKIKITLFPIFHILVKIPFT